MSYSSKAPPSEIKNTSRQKERVMGRRSRRAAMSLAEPGPGLEAPVRLSPRLDRGEDRFDQPRRSGEQVCGSLPEAQHLTIDVILELRVYAPAGDILQAQILVAIDFRSLRPFAEVRLASGIRRHQIDDRVNP